jgi:Putative transposase/Transposase zinc-binding domain
VTRADMVRPNLELAEIFRRHGEAWRTANAGHVNLTQRRVMTAIEICRTAALGGHVERCQDCAHTRIAYNSCRNRHCPKCQWRSAAAWLAAREAELLPVPYFHFVFALPAAIGAMAFQNKAKVYGLLFKAAAETLIAIAADRKHLGAEIGVLAVLHTWGQNLHHHPHVHCVVPGGGISPDGKRWIASKLGFFLPVRVLSRLFRRLFLEGLAAAFEAGELQFFSDLVHLNETNAFAATLAPLRGTEWVVYAKETFAGREQLLAYLARYTHRVAITNSRLLDVDETHVLFRWKKGRQRGGHKSKVMRITTGEFMRRFLLHVMPNGFHRIRHYGFLANGKRADKLALCRSLLAVPAASVDYDKDPVDRNKEDDNDPGTAEHEPPPCPGCGGRMAIIEIFNGTLCRPYHVRRLDGL